MASANQEWRRTTRILENLPDAVVACTRDGQILFVNALAEELFGYSRDELVGQPVQMLWPERVRDRYSHNMIVFFGSDRRCGSRPRSGACGATARSSRAR